MARPIWKGHISFGLVNIPIVLYPAEQRSELHFHLIDRRNKARVRYERVNEKTGKEVPWDQIVKGFEDKDGNTIILTEEDFKRAAVEGTETVEIAEFVDADAIGYAYFDEPYYLAPNKGGEKGYVILREVLKRTGKAGIAKVVLRTKLYLAAVIAQGDGLVMALLRFEEELRPSDEVEFPRKNIKDYKVNPGELNMAEKLVETMSVEWKPEKYVNDYSQKLMRFIKQKQAEGGKAVRRHPESSARRTKAEVVDMMDLLRQSVAESGSKRKARKARGKDAATKPALHRRAG